MKKKFYTAFTIFVPWEHVSFTLRWSSKGMKQVMFALGMAMIIATNGFAGDPRIEGWFTKDSEKYARLYPTANDQGVGNAVTTWSRGPGVQSVPVLAGVCDVSYSRDWIYIHTSGLASYVMGPWYNDLAKTRMFPSYPADTKTTYRIPRNPTIANAKSLTGLGPIGYFVNGVALFDDRDAFALQWQSRYAWGRDLEPRRVC